MSTSSTTHQPTPLDCILDPTLAPKPSDQAPSFNLTITNSKIGGVQIDTFYQRGSALPVEKRWDVEVISDGSDEVELHRTPARSTAPTPSFQAFCGRADDGVMVYPPACADMEQPTLPAHLARQAQARFQREAVDNLIEIDLAPLPLASRMHRPFQYDPDVYRFDPEEGRRLRMLAEQVCAPHDTCPERAGDFDRTAAFELAKMIHEKHQANVEIARILSR